MSDENDRIRNSGLAKILDQLPARVFGDARVPRVWLRHDHEPDFAQRRRRRPRRRRWVSGQRRRDQKRHEDERLRRQQHFVKGFIEGLVKNFLIGLKKFLPVTYF